MLVIDHRFPVSRGGGNDESNLVTACEDCNSGKSDEVYRELVTCPTQLISNVRQLVVQKIDLDDIDYAAQLANGDWGLVAFAIDLFWGKVFERHQSEDKKLNDSRKD